VMEPGEIGGFGCGQPEELFVVEMAGDTEPVVTLLRGESGEKKRSKKQGSRDTGHAKREPSSEGTASQESLAFRRRPECGAWPTEPSR